MDLFTKADKQKEFPDTGHDPVFIQLYIFTVSFQL